MMNQLIFSKSNYSIIIGFAMLISGCNQKSEIVTDTSAGLNGGFEIVEEGLPVNWLMYTNKTVPNSDFEIVLDKKIVKEGTQSLRFDVLKCSSVGSWQSPGFTNEFFDSGKFEGDAKYKVSFWVKNNGATYKIAGGGVGALEGEMKLLIEDNEQIDEWRLLEFEINVPKERWLRLELNIIQPGTFWIDDISIQKI